MQTAFVLMRKIYSYCIDASEVQRILNTPLWSCSLLRTRIWVSAGGREQMNPGERTQTKPHFDFSDNMSLCIRTGFYRQEINKTVWDVPERYRDLIQVGTGAYGTVWWVHCFYAKTPTQPFVILTRSGSLSWETKLRVNIALLNNVLRSFPEK